MFPTIPDGVSPTWYFVCVGLAVLITGISKSGFGGGTGILAIPLMALVMGPREMLGVMLPLLIACDILSNLHYLGEYDWTRLRWLLPGAAVGIGIGTILLYAMRGMSLADFNQLMSFIVGVICLAVVGMQVYRLTGRELPTLPPHPGSALSIGLVAGAISTLNHGAGPIVTVYLLQEHLEKRKLVGTLLMYFLLGNCLKLPTYLLPIRDGSAMINLRSLKDSIWFIPLIPIGTLTGAWLNKRISEKPFSVVMYVAAAVTAAQMIYKAIEQFAMKH